MAVRPAPNPSDNVNAPLNACPSDRRAARRLARTVRPVRSVPLAGPIPTAPVCCAPSPRSSAATAAARLTASPHRLAYTPGSFRCSSSAPRFPLGDGVVGTTHFPGRPGAAATYSNFNIRGDIAACTLPLAIVGSLYAQHRRIKSTRGCGGDETRDYTRDIGGVVFRVAPRSDACPRGDAETVLGDWLRGADRGRLLGF